MFEITATRIVVPNGKTCINNYERAGHAPDIPLTPCRFLSASSPTPYCTLFSHPLDFIQDLQGPGPVSIKCLRCLDACQNGVDLDARR